MKVNISVERVRVRVSPSTPIGEKFVFYYKMIKFKNFHLFVENYISKFNPVLLGVN